MGDFFPLTIESDRARDVSNEGSGTGESTADPSWRNTVRPGAVGGALATVLMTLFRMPIADSLPPTAEFWATFVGDGDPEDYPLVALALHLAYGVGAGVAFVAAFVPLAGDSRLHVEGEGTLLGALYALPLSAFGSRALLSGLLDLDLESDERWIFHVGHLVYGLMLGAWLGSAVTDR